jgi:hypothetical protein
VGLGVCLRSRGGDREYVEGCRYGRHGSMCMCEGVHVWTSCCAYQAQAKQAGGTWFYRSLSMAD